MTRQKKEIIRKIEEIDNWIEADMELGCGFAPPDAIRKRKRKSISFKKNWPVLGTMEVQWKCSMIRAGNPHIMTTSITR